ncbi:MAG: hypothetical protein ACW98Y_03060 [Candidatus Thorarchaeota archaeon]|jgi:tRNA pseudouridine-54 N-methylase
MTDFPGLRFIAIFPDIPLDGRFILKDLPGSGKRIDVLCRSLAACFDWASSSESKDNLEFIAILSHSLLMRFKVSQDASTKGETWWATTIREAIRGNPQDFVSVEEVPLEDSLKSIKRRDPHLYVLEEEGVTLASIIKSSSAPQYSFMLGNHRGFDERTIQIIQNLDIPRVSLGHRSYLGSHCVATVISHFERIEK